MKTITTISTPEERLGRLGLTLPGESAPGGNYVAVRGCGELLYLAGQGPRTAGGQWITGTVGLDVTIEQAYQHPRQAGLELLSTATRAACGLNRIEMIKVFGMVRATPDFTRHPEVINGCSDLFVDVLGERGKHARSAVGMGSLPNGMTVEIEVIVRVLT
jgi:enamine deaminase RidA (YjgF/YER057c/UK114 family)